MQFLSNGSKLSIVGFSMDANEYLKALLLCSTEARLAPQGGILG